MYDVIIVGAGVSGCAIARELSRYRLDVLVLEKALDVCEGTSKANSGIVHAGYDAKPGTLKAKLNVEGSRRMKALSGELDFPYKQNGSMVLCFEEQGIDTLKELEERGRQNGVPDIRILTGEQARDLEPEISDRVAAALYAPSGAIVCPFGLTIALAENAADNGVHFKLGMEVTEICAVQGGYQITAGNEIFTARMVVNAAGVYADRIHNMISREKMKITPRRGEYLLCDKKAGNMVSHTLFQLPTALGKGVLVTPTVHGNLLIGPTAQDIDDKEGTETSREGLAAITERGALSVRELPTRQVITSFAGLRAHGSGDDFCIEEVRDAEGFIDVAGIESPGLSCAPAIGEYLAGMIEEKAGFGKNPNFNPVRKGIVKAARLNTEERAELIRKNPAYGAIVCRCETISEGEIVDAITRTLGARSMDGIKRRVRQGMGRCQAGFCTPRAMEILSREMGIPITEICKNRKGSEMIKGEEA